MRRLALERALPAGWVDEVFEQHRQRQYARELLFSTVIELMTLVSLGLRPSLHAAARAMPALPVSLSALYDKVNHTEPAVLGGLVRGSAERLSPVVAAVGSGASLPGWRLRILDGNHLPASEKRLGALRAHRGAALPGQALVVYDPDSGLVTDLVACEDAHASERTVALPLLERAQPGQGDGHGARAGHRDKRGADAMAAHRTGAGRAHRDGRERDPAMEQPARGRRGPAGGRAVSQALAHRGDVPALGVCAA